MSLHLTSIADADQGQSSFIAQAGTAATYGTFTLATNGGWTYTASDSQTAIQQLGAGQSITDSFTAVSSDGTASKVGLFIQMSGGHAGPDGMALDTEGGLVVAHPSTTAWRFDALGRPTHHVDCGDDIFCTNIAFAGNDLRFLGQFARVAI